VAGSVPVAGVEVEGVEVEGLEVEGLEVEGLEVEGRSDGCPAGWRRTDGSVVSVVGSPAVGAEPDGAGVVPFRSR